jgi:hypothetical protein
MLNGANMKRFCEFIGEMYTIGHTKTYDDAIEQEKINRNSDNPEARDDPGLHKLGVKPNEKTAPFRKPNQTIHPNEAGAVFATEKHARDAIKGKKAFSVYKLQGDFKKDSFYNPETGFHHLKVDRKITHRV